MTDPFNRMLAFVLTFEGGEVNDPRDPGGHTNMGVTQRTLDYARQHYPEQNLPNSVTDLTHDHVAFIYREQYLKPLKVDYLPFGVQFILFDAAINQGVGDAARFLQRVVSAAVDGAIGPQTLAYTGKFLESHTLETLIEALAVERAFDYAMNDSIDQIYGRGWYRRLFACYREAIGYEIHS